jgi:hypothetical protein
MRMSLQQFGAFLIKAGRALPREVKAAEREDLADAVETARRHSQGPYTLQELASMGHPYATRAPNPPMHPGEINLQSGEFESAWQEGAPVGGAGGMKTTARNTASYSGYLDRGTKRMIERPLTALVEQEVEPRRKDRLVKAIERAFTP